MRSWDGECSRAFTDWFGPRTRTQGFALLEESFFVDHRDELESIDFHGQ